MTNVESEYILENNLIKKLVDLGYEKVSIKNEDELKSNLKIQLEKLNKNALTETGNPYLTDKEFEKIYNELNVGDNFERALTLRNKSYKLTRESKPISIIYFNSNKWCENEFQVANQITMVGNRTNRYDVTILINGFPMVQIELKRRGGELDEAFRQVNRYKRESYKDLFKFIQIFIISTGNETRYFSTNEDSEGRANKKFSFKWTNEKNEPINSLLTEENGKESFVQSFLGRCQIGKMIAKYMIISKENQNIKILRPYQYHAVEAILERIEKTNKGGFIWHTTGSGKTLTSFKAAQEIKNSIKKIDKVFFVVDRRDLNSQTLDEFRGFDSDEDIFDTKNTESLIKQIESDSSNLVVTTLQKFDIGIKKLNKKYPNGKQSSRDKRVVFIFDECHRSQFGETNRLIRKYFKNLQMIGFTGTPIKEANNNNKQTTYELFDNKLLHDYKISEAINDKNVLGFSIEYFKTYNLKKDILIGDDETTKTPDRKEVLEHPTRVENIVKNIFEIHNKKTYNREFNAMFTIANIKLLQKYYEEFKKQNALLDDDKKLKVVSIFSIQENDDYSDGEKPSREFLHGIIDDYSKLKNKKFSKDGLNWFNTYRVNLIKTIKDNDIDIVLVVNMLTTGFDAPKLNTLYVDKNLEYHGLLQAFSRTNRLDNDNKTQGNIVVYSRPNKSKVDESIKEFSSDQGLSLVLKESYEHYVELFNKLFLKLIKDYKNPDYVNSLRDDDKKIEFVKKFREIITELNILKTFYEFDNFNDLECDAQLFEDYSESYRRLWREQQDSKDKISILNEIDFKIEQLSEDKIDHNYIKRLLENFEEEYATVDDYRKVTNDLVDKLNRYSTYPQKLIDLIEDFVNKQLERIEDGISFREALTYDTLIGYLDEEKKNRLNALIDKYELDDSKFEGLIENYELTSGFSHFILRELVSTMKEMKEKAKKENVIPLVYKRNIIRKIKNEIEDIYLNTQLSR